MRVYYKRNSGPFSVLCFESINAFVCGADGSAIERFADTDRTSLSKFCANACSARSMSPSSTHYWNRRRQVWHDAYSRGRAFHRGPVFSIQSTLSNA